MSDVFNALIAETEGDQYKVSIKKIGKFIKKYARVIVAVVVAVVVTVYTAGAATAAFGSAFWGAVAGGAAGGAVSGLIMTGSLKGMLEGAVFGAITAGFAAGIKETAWGAKVVKAVKTGFDVSIKTAQGIALSLGHGVIGGVRAVVSGGKFLAGFITGVVGKAITFATDMWASGLNIDSEIGRNITQGLVVASAGGVVSVLAGGSFELGFITAGLAFAANKLATAAIEKSVEKQRNRIAESMENMEGDDWTVNSNERNLPGHPKCNLAVDEALDNTQGVTSPANPRLGDGYSPTALEWADSANDDYFNDQGWSDAFNSDDITPIRGDIMTDGGHMGVYTGSGNITSAPISNPVRTVPATVSNYYYRRWMGGGG